MRKTTHYPTKVTDIYVNSITLFADTWQSVGRYKSPAAWEVEVYYTVHYLTKKPMTYKTNTTRSAADEMEIYQQLTPEVLTKMVKVAMGYTHDHAIRSVHMYTAGGERLL
jgi:hypothetical protein